jgi:hypothetical protein
MPTINQLFDRLNEAERELSVWRKIVELLNASFISRDSDQAPEQITLDSGAIVPEATIQAVLDIIQDEQISPREAIRRRVLTSELKLTVPELEAGEVADGAEGS